MSKRTLLLFLVFLMIATPVAATTPWTTKPPLGSTINWSHPLSKGLVGCWLMNEGGGLKLENLVDRNNLTLTQGGAWVPSNKGCCVDLNSASIDYLISQRNFPTGTQKVSYSLWVKTSQSSGSSVNYHLINWGTTVNNNMTHLILNGASGVMKWKYGAWGFDNLSTTGGVSDGLWHNIVVVYDGTNYKLYIDGKLDATSAAYSSLNIAAATLVVGAYRGDLDTSQANNFNGFLNNLFMWQGHALSPSEIKQLYQEPYCFIEYKPWTLWGAITTEAATVITNIQNAIGQGIGRGIGSGMR